MHDRKQAEVRTVGGHPAGILRAGSRASAGFPHGRRVRRMIFTFFEKMKRVSKQMEGEKRNRKRAILILRTLRPCGLLYSMRVAGPHHWFFRVRTTMRTKPIHRRAP